MSRGRLLATVVASVVFVSSFGVPAAAQPALLTDSGWGELSQIPDPFGVAGPFVGVSGGKLVVAGGANFAEGRRPWNGGVKTWRDAVFVLDDPAGHWRACETRLPRPLGYGVSITAPEGVWCIGGSDRERHYADVFLLQVDGGEIRFVPQPSLPVPLANSCGALVGSKLVVAGGIESPTSTRAVKHVFVLDTAALPEKRQWKSIASWPGSGRMLATAGATENDFYLFGGVELKADANGAPERIKPFLSEAWRLSLDDTGGGTWARMADLPAPRAACPTPAPLVVGNRLLLISGDDGTLTAAEEDRHTGFPAAVLSYDIAADRWRSQTPILRWNGTDPATKPEECVWPPVTTGAAIWQGLIVVPSGEIRPGVRTRRVLTAGEEILD